MDVSIEDFLRRWAAVNMPSLTWDEEAFTAVVLMMHEFLRQSLKAERETTTRRIPCPLTVLNRREP